MRTRLLALLCSALLLCGAAIDDNLLYAVRSNLPRVIYISTGIDSFSNTSHDRCFSKGGAIVSTTCGGASTNFGGRQAFIGYATVGRVVCRHSMNVPGAASETVTLSARWGDGTGNVQTDVGSCIFPADNTAVDGLTWDCIMNTRSPYANGNFLLHISFSNPASAFNSAVNCVVDLHND